MAVMHLINLGITQVLVKLLINLQHSDTISSEVLAQEVLWLLGQVMHHSRGRLAANAISRLRLILCQKILGGPQGPEIRVKVKDA